MPDLKPVVTSQSGRERKGKGFSPDEIKDAGLKVADARKLKISVDRKRKTKHEENVEALKHHAEKTPVAKPKEKKSKN